jgi:fumarate reductase flavoprotein subunit
MTAYNFEAPPSPIPESEIVEVVAADIVVAGAGPSGLAAAVSAAQAGAAVVLVEKFHSISAPGGPGAPFIDSRLQKERAQRGKEAPSPNARMMPPMPVDLPPLPGAMGPPAEMPTGPPPVGLPPVGPPVGVSECGPVPTKEEMVQGLWKASAGRADERLIKLWADKSGEVADWLVDMANEQGIDVMVGRFSHMFCKPGCSPFCLNRTPVGCTQDDGELCLLSMMAEKGRQLGVDIRTSTRAVRLIRPGNQGRVTGLIASRTDGGYVRLSAKKAVILCTGDYGMDDEMIERYCPWVLGLPKLMLETVSGDGHKMGLWAGAVIEEAPHCAVLHFNSTNEKPVVHFRPVGMMNRGCFLYVNKRGERIVNEACSDELLANIVLRQPGKAFWQVFDARSVSDDNRRDVEEGLESGAVLKADTIEALAPQFGANPRVLRATVDRYNELVRSGQDPDFGKKPEFLTMALDQPPFYACESPPDLLCVMGGLIRNGHGQVLDKNYEVIPGLYAAGNIAGGFWGDTYPMGFLGGIARSHALVFGRLAGLHAASNNS